MYFSLSYLGTNENSIQIQIYHIIFQWILKKVKLIVHDSVLFLLQTLLLFIHIEVGVNRP